jgi:hypothetical protein
MITLFFGPDECRADYDGPFVGGIMGGSFITYVCDRPAGHDAESYHIDSTMGFAWSDAVEVPRVALAGSDPTG